MPRERLVLGGESSSWEWVKGLREKRPECKIMSHYGPTEATVGNLTYEVEWDRSEYYRSVVPVGRPLENTEAYLLDRWLQPSPIGVGGELYIGGKCIVRGYLNHPEITAERFIPNIYSCEAGGRLYKTGDLVRYLRWGEIEFLRRMDQQVKIRGYRVELGEIETRLREHECVAEAAVIARGEGVEKRLVGYVVMREGEEGRVSDLREYLKERLPGYMAPGAYVRLERLPLMANGKLDKKALPEPEVRGRELEEGYQGPGRRLRRWWRESGGRR